MPTITSLPHAGLESNFFSVRKLPCLFFSFWGPESITYCPRQEEITCTDLHGGTCTQEGQHKPMTSKMKLQTGNAPK